MLATIRISFFLFITTLLFSCATQMTPEQVLQMQEREETIIAEQFSRKLEVIEGIWRSGNRETIAIYKRGDKYNVQELSSGRLIFTSNKKSEYEFYGDCLIRQPIEMVEGKHKMVSVDDNSIDYVCARKNYITNLEKILTDGQNTYRCLFCEEKEPKAEDFSQKIRLIRVYPVDLKEHNSQY